MSSRLLTVRDGNVVDGSGHQVILRGYNIGGWMNMENFLTGYPGTESQHRRALRRVLGPELYAAFFEEFMAVFFDETDARYLARSGSTRSGCRSTTGISKTTTIRSTSRTKV